MLASTRIKVVVVKAGKKRVASNGWCGGGPRLAALADVWCERVVLVPLCQGDATMNKMDRQ